jgi:CDP-diacylglycerol--glycerol-3-phosphate 3-phosphatidyltransferase
MAHLQRTWRRLGLLTMLVVLAGFGGLARVWALGPAIRWLALAGLTAGYSLVFLKRNLGRNRASAAGAIYPELGAATRATLMRGILLAGVGGFLFSPRPPGGLAWAPAILFATAELLDYLDGYLARRSGRQTELGVSFDLALDNLGMLIGSALAVWYRVLPWPFLTIGLAGYLFQLGRWARRRSGREVRELPPSSSRRPIAGLMMGFLSAVLWPILEPPATILAGRFFLAPLLVSFARDWLVVSGLVNPASEGYRRARSLARTVLLRWVPVPARAVTVLSLVAEVSTNAGRLPARAMLFQQAGLPFGERAVGLFLILEGLGALLIGLGIAGRAAASILLFPIGFTIVAAGLTRDARLLLSGILTVLILGTGAYSLWQPEDRLFTRRLRRPMESVGRTEGSG